MELIDSHCHLTTAPANERGAVLARAAARGVTRCICIGASSGVDDAFKAVELSEEFENVWATVGVHPHDAAITTELSRISELAKHPRVVAIGETGLDNFKDWSPAKLQEELFRNSIRLAREVGKPLVIHCREAGARTLEILKEERASEVGGVFHCYAEDVQFAKLLSDINFLVSFPGIITFKKAENVRAVVKDIPLNRIMVETDMPFLAPEPYRGRGSEPAHVYEVAQKIAEIKGITIEEVARVTTANAERLFRIGV